MPIEVDGVRYLNATEAAVYLEVSKPTFYKHVQPAIDMYRNNTHGAAYYRESDLKSYRGISVSMQKLPENAVVQQQLTELNAAYQRYDDLISGKEPASTQDKVLQLQATNDRFEVLWEWFNMNHLRLVSRGRQWFLQE